MIDYNYNANMMTINYDDDVCQEQLYLLWGSSGGQLSPLSDSSRRALFPLRSGGLLHAQGEAVRSVQSKFCLNGPSSSAVNCTCRQHVQ